MRPRADQAAAAQRSSLSFSFGLSRDPTLGKTVPHLYCSKHCIWVHVLMTSSLWEGFCDMGKRGKVKKFLENIISIGPRIKALERFRVRVRTVWSAYFLDPIQAPLTHIPHLFRALSWETLIAPSLPPSVASSSPLLIPRSTYGGARDTLLSAWSPATIDVVYRVTHANSEYLPLT